MAIIKTLFDNGTFQVEENEETAELSLYFNDEYVVRPDRLGELLGFLHGQGIIPGFSKEPTVSGNQSGNHLTPRKEL